MAWTTSSAPPCAPGATAWQPADAGLPASRGRRAPGLRREEVAALAGLSVDYLARLEQGRAERPSPSVLGALARALRLDDRERAHLYRLAGHVAPGDGRIDAHLTPGVQRILDRLIDTPVLVCDAAWNPIANNAMAVALVGDFSDLPPRERNIAWRAFCAPPGRGAPCGRSRREAFEQGWCRPARGDRPLSRRRGAGPVGARPARQQRAVRPALGQGGVRPQARSRKTIRHPEVGDI